MKTIEEYDGGTVNWDMVPDHVRHGVRSYVERGGPTGDFLTLVFEGRLFDAAIYADHINEPALAKIAKFLVWYTPSECRGSPEKVHAWREKGGLSGRQEQSNAD